MASVNKVLSDKDKRFWDKVDIRDPYECWLWKGAKKPRGYGNLRRDKVYTTAHRVSWQINFGDIPKGMQVQHSCDNTSCCNPNHLMLGTVMSNYVDMVKKGRGNSNHTNRAFGENHKNHKLKKTEVEEIRCLYASGSMFQKDIGKKYDVSQRCISIIVRGEGRNHG